MYFGVRCQGKIANLSVLFINGFDGYGILAADTERELL
jgi:hypothetical protein